MEKKNYKEIAQIVNRTERAISTLLNRLGYQYRLEQYWKGDELLYIKNHCKDMTYQEMGEALGRTERAVKTKVYQMGYHKDKC